MLSFRKDKFVVKKEVDNHDDDRGEDKSAGSEDKFIGEWNMKSLTNIVGEFVEWSEETKKLSKTWSNSDG